MAVWGDDHLKSFDYMLSNIRTGCKNYYTWFSEGEQGYDNAEAWVYSALCDRLNSRVYAVSFVCRYLSASDDDVIPGYSMVSREAKRQH